MFGHLEIIRLLFEDERVDAAAWDFEAFYEAKNEFLYNSTEVLELLLRRVLILSDPSH